LKKSNRYQQRNKFPNSNGHIASQRIGQSGHFVDTIDAKIVGNNVHQQKEPHEGFFLDPKDDVIANLWSKKKKQR